MFNDLVQVRNWTTPRERVVRRVLHGLLCRFLEAPRWDLILRRTTSVPSLPENLWILIHCYLPARMQKRFHVLIFTANSATNLHISGKTGSLFPEHSITVTSDTQSHFDKCPIYREVNGHNGEFFFSPSSFFYCRRKLLVNLFFFLKFKLQVE